MQLIAVETAKPGTDSRRFEDKGTPTNSASGLAGSTLMGHDGRCVTHHCSRHRKRVYLTTRNVANVKSDAGMTAATMVGCSRLVGPILIATPASGRLLAAIENINCADAGRAILLHERRHCAVVSAVGKSASAVPGTRRRKAADNCGVVASVC